tara:strand:- start:244 stop:1443 length:1200 start_codon:yes stop_codon:yes gene_type:complete
MATYTDINGVKLIATGDEAGTWGTSTNTNLQILERAANGFAQIALTGTTFTLTQSTTPSSAEDGHYKAIEFTGTPGGTCTVTLEQNDHARMYMFLNSTNQTVTITQGSGGNVSILASDGAIVLADGAGSGAEVKDLTAALQSETAARLATARDFSITGDVTASAISFDGTGNVALSAGITAGSIVNADINASAAIADTKLATISTGGKVDNSATTATNSNSASAIVARDGSGNFSAGTISAALSGNASSATTAAALTGDVTKSGDFTVDASGDIVLDADGGDILFKDGGTTRGSIDIGTADTLKFEAGTSEEMRLTTSGLNVLNGLRVGDTSAPTDNDIHATANVSAGGAFELTAGANNWSFQVLSNNLFIYYAGAKKMKLDTSGNLTVIGNVTAFGSI